MIDIKNSIVTLCIIDDISSIVEGISKSIRWGEHGIEVVGIALNGEDGIALIQREQPDIIVTDIRMPKLDGLELAQYVREHAKNSRILFITGYPDFHYAQQALRLGVADFITKPFSLEQIEQAVLQQKQAVIDNRLRTMKLKGLEQQAQDHSRVRNEHALNLLIRHAMDAQEASQMWNSLQLPLHRFPLALALIQIDHLDVEPADISMKEVGFTEHVLCNIVEETVSQYTQGYLFKHSFGRFIALVSPTAEHSASFFAEEICHNMRHYAKFTVSIGISDLILSAHALPQGFKQAEIALSHRFYTNGDAVSDYSSLNREAAKEWSGWPIHSKQLEQELILAVSCGNRLGTLSILDELLGRLAFTEPEKLKAYCNHIAFILLCTYHDKLTEDEFTSIPSYLRDRLPDERQTFHELKAFLVELCELGCGLLDVRSRSGIKQAIEEAVRYMHDRMHEELTISQCAQHVHLSPSYFTAMFKRMTGQTFHACLNEMRMEQAKRLLQADFPIQEVAEQVGYKERRYFTAVFKKHIGVTPSEFKQSDLKGDCR